MFKDIVKGVARNTSVMFFQVAITWSSTFVMMLFLPRYLGPVEYGRLFLANSLVGIFQIFVSFGGNYLVAKEISRSPGNVGNILVNAAAHRFIFALISIIGIIAFSRVAGYPTEVNILLLINSFSLVWFAGVSALQGCYQGLEVMQYTSLGTVVQVVFESVLVVGGLMLGAKAVVIVAIGVVATALHFLTLFALSRKIIPSLPKIDWLASIKLAKKSGPYFLFVIFSTIYYRIDSVMLSKMAPEETVGWYGGAYRLFDILGVVPYIFSTAVYPVLSRVWKEETETHRRTTQKSLEFMVMAGIPICVGAITFADKVVDLFYGLGGYSPSVTVLQTLSLGVVFLYVDMVLGATLLSSDRQNHQSLVALTAIPVNVGLNLLLIPYFQNRSGNGGIGAALATVLTEFCIMIAILYLIPKGTLRGFRLSVISKSILSALAVVTSIWIMTSLHFSWLLQIPITILLYTGLLVALRTFEPEEEEFLRSLLSLQSLKKLKHLVSL